MDRHKKFALQEWLKALSDRSVSDFEDLRDGSIVISILKTVGHNIIPSDAVLDSVQQRYQAIQKYVEGMYNQSFEDGTLINFHLLQRKGVDADRDVAKEMYHMEIGKMLLVLLCSVVQDRCCEPFIRPALTMDERSQTEMKDMIEFVVSNSSDMQLRPDFADVLKLNTESSTHVDAAIFLKLVADGVVTSPAVAAQSLVTPEPSSGSSFVFSNSPQVAKLKSSIHDIMSPLRIMSLSSSPLGTPQSAGARVSPLGALMQSPQLVQKTQLRQKVQELRRLEIALKTEQHLVFELEQDLKERAAQIDEKDTRLRELESRVAEVRVMRDQLDELEVLRSEKDKQDEEIVKLRVRMAERQDVQEQNQVLQKENKELTASLQEAWDELKLMESVRHSNEEFRVKCHKYQLESAELQASVQRRDEDMVQLRETVAEAQARHQSALQICQSLRRDKEELEELLGLKNDSELASPSCGQEESMGVLTEMKLKEVQAECDKLRASWVDPDRHAAMCTQLQMEEESRQTFEEKFIETKKRSDQQECKIQELEKELSEVQAELHTQCAGHDVLKGDYENLCQAKDRLFSELEACKAESSKTEDLLKEKVDIVTQQRLEMEKQSGVIHELRSHNHEIENELETSKLLVSQIQMEIKNNQEAHCKEKSDFVSIIQQLELKIDSNNQEFSEEKHKLESDLAESEMRISVLHNEKEMQEKSITELRISAEKEKSAVQEQVKHLGEELESRNKLIEEQKTEVKKLSYHTEELSLRIHELNGSLEKSEMLNIQFESRVNGMQEEHSREKSDFSSMIQQLELKIENNNEQFSEDKRKLESDLSESEMRISALHDEKEIQEKSITELRISAEKEMSVVQEQVKHLGEELESRNKIIEEQKTEVEKLSHETEELSLRIHELNGSLEKSEMLNTQFESRVSTMQEEHSKEKSDFSSMIQQFELKIECSNQEFSEEKHKLECDLAESEMRISALQNEKEIQVKSITELRISAEKEKSVVQEQVKHLGEDLESRNKLIEEQKTEVEKLSHETEELSLRIHELNGSLEKSEMLNTQFESQVNGMQEEHSREKSEFSSMIQQLELKIENNNEQFSEEKRKLESDLAQSEMRISALRNEKEMQEKSITELRISAEKEMSVVQEQVKHLGEELESRNKIIEEQKTEVEKLSHHTEELSLRIHELNGSLEKSEMLNTQFESQVNGMQEEHSREKSDFSSMIQQLESKIESYNRELSEEKHKLESGLAESEMRISALQNEKEIQEKSITELRISAEKEKSVVQEQVKHLGEDLESRNKLIEEQKTEVEKLSHETKELSLRIHELNGSLEKSEMLNIQFESRVNGMQEEHSREKSEFSSMIQQLELKIENNNQQFSEEKHKIESDFARVTSEYEAKFCALHKEKKSEKEMQEKRIAEFRISAEEEKNFLVERMKNIEAELKSRNQIIEEQTVEVEKLSKGTEVLKLHVHELEVSLQKSEVLKAEFESQVKSMEEEHRKETTDFSSEMQQLAVKIEISEKQFSEEKGKLESDIAKGTSDYEMQISALMNEKKAEKEIHEKSIATLRITAEEEKCAFVERMKNIEGELISRNQTIDKQKNEIEHLTKVIEELKLRIHELNGSLEKSETLVAQSRVDMKDLDVQHSKEKSDLSGMIQQLESTIENIGRQFSEEKGKFESDLKRTTSEYEIKITALHNEKRVEKDMQEKTIAELRISVEEENVLVEKMKKMEEELQEKENCILDMKFSALENNGRIQSLCDQVEYMQSLQTALEKAKEENMKITEEYETKISELKHIHQQNLCEKKSAIENISSELSALVKSHKITVDETEILKNKILAEEDEKKKYEIQLEHMKEEIVTKNKEGETLRSELCVLEEKLRGMNERMAALEAEYAQAQEEFRRIQEQLSWEKGEREEVTRQRDYIQDRNDTLSAELSSQQQQLAAVEEEKRVLERAVSAQCEERDRQQRFTQIEKLELERELQASQKCYEATQKSVTEVEHQLERSSNERSGLETRNRELEQRIYSYLDREKRLMEDKQHQMDKAAELNGTLRRQLDQKCKEILEINAKSNEDLDKRKELVNEMKARFEREAQTLTEEKTALEAEVATLQQVRDQLDGVTAERNRLQEINEKYNLHYNKKKETIVELTQKLQQAKDELVASQRVEEKLLKETAPMREKLEAELMKNKALGNKVRSLEAQVDLADRKLREMQDSSLGIFWGSGADFQKILNSRENPNDASFFENHPPSIPSKDSFVQPYPVKRSSSLEHTSSPDKTLTGHKSVRRSRHSSQSASNVSVFSHDKADTVSIGSASSLAYRLRSRESTASLNRSVNSVESCRSTASVPRGTGALFHCEDEPMEFEWGRLSELQRRNTLCPAHLKTAYPIETQTYRSEQYRDDALRQSTISSKTLKSIEQLTTSRKRKPVFTSSDSSSDSEGKSKLAKAGPVYHKPGPPTPGNSRRNSGKGAGQSSQSPSNRRQSMKSPRTPVLRSGRTPKRTLRKTPQRQAALDNMENPGSGKKLSKKRESVSFCVGFSPHSQGKTNRLRRQQGFVRMQPQSTSQNRKPLAARNFLQTGV